jgi:hypothetical protein
LKRSIPYLWFLGGIVLLILNFMVLFEITPEPPTNGINVSTEISLTKNLFDSNQTNDSPKNHQSDKNCPIFLVSMSQAPSPQAHIFFNKLFMWYNSSNIIEI